MHAIPPSEPDFWANDPDDLPLHGTPDDLLAAQSALQTTRMAIARWTGGIHRPQMLQVGSLHVSAQARWYARACEGFDKWREDGGFSQDDSMEKRFEVRVPDVSVDSEGACVE